MPSPVFVTPLAYPLSQHTAFGQIGAYQNGSRLWIISLEVASAIANPNFISYYSDNNGATWTRGGVGPTFSPGSNNAVGESYPGTGTDVILAYHPANGAGGRKVMIFDMTGTGTFGTPVTFPYDFDDTPVQPLILPSGDWAVVWAETIGVGNVKVSISTSADNGTSWSSRLDVNTGTANKRLGAVVIDGGGNIGIQSMNIATFANTYSLTDGASIITENSMGAAASIGSYYGLNNQNVGIFDAGSDSVAFSWVVFDNASNQIRVVLFVGTPSANPVFTQHILYTVDLDTDPDYWLDFPWLMATPGGFTIIFGWGDTFGLFADGTYKLYRIDATALGASWSTPLEIFDIHTTPFPTDPVTDQLEFVWTWAQTDGQINIVTGTLQDVAPSDQWCGVLGFLSLPAASTAGEFALEVGLEGSATYAPPALTAACPVVPTAEIGVPYSGFVVASGGVAPYTFALFSGSLPPGLSLNTSTGEISGTPTTAGSYSWTVRVTDSLGQIFDIACSTGVPIVINPGRTLRFQIGLASGRPSRWFPHEYANRAVVHYLDEPDAVKPNDQQLLYLSGSSVFKFGGNVDVATAITSVVTTPSTDLGDERLQKLYVDVMEDVEGTGTLNLLAQYNNGLVDGPLTSKTVAGSRVQFLQNISSLADLSLYRNINARFSWTGGPAGPKLNAWEPAGYLQPYISQFMVTQFINLSFPGWKHHRRLYAGLISNSTVLFTIKTQDGRTYGPISVSSTSGQFRIFPLMIPHGCKDLSFAYQIDGQGQNFALFTDAWTIETKEWEGPEYINLSPWKT